MEKSNLPRKVVSSNKKLQSLYQLIQMTKRIILLQAMKKIQKEPWKYGKRRELDEVMAIEFPEVHDK